MAPWDNVRPHPSFKVLPALNIDFLAHADARVRETALEDLVVRVFVVLCCVLFCCVLCVCWCVVGPSRSVDRSRLMDG